nr:hypothetical protein [Delftia acidovorans]
MTNQMPYAVSTPASNEHAIERVMCEVIFNHPLPPDVVEGFQARLNEFASELPGRQEESRAAPLPMLPPDVPPAVIEMMSRGDVRASRFTAAPMVQLNGNWHFQILVLQLNVVHFGDLKIFQNV